MIVTRLDRLARSTRDLLNTLEAIEAAKAILRSLHDAWRKPPTRHGRLILIVLGGGRRHLIVHRLSEGRNRAKGRSVMFDSPPRPRRAIARREAGDQTMTDIGRSYRHFALDDESLAIGLR